RSPPGGQSPGAERLYCRERVQVSGDGGYLVRWSSMGTETMRVQKKTGDEPFEGMPHTLREYWAWAHSDIASNAERGKLAEYIVHCAVKSQVPFRTEWDPFDVLSEEGIKIEVKCSAYLQTWSQKQFSRIQFDIAPKNAWDAKTNLYAKEKCRSADVYV